MTPQPPQPRHNPDGNGAPPRSSTDPQHKGTRGADEDDGKQENDDGEDDDGDSGEDDDDEDDDEEEEPQLKYARLTQHLSPVYRNGDATSAFIVAGDKMIIGTHNGNIHVVQLPTFQSLRVYHAHAASVTSISISPFPPPLPNDKIDASLRPGTTQPRPASRQSGVASPAATSRRIKDPAPLPRLASNEIYISTSSMDGNVCIQSLMDVKDVQLRNFARPVQAVSLSPEYKLDRTYLSGGLAGTAAAAASGWLGSMGLSHNTGKDTILHSGEGTISSIKWSLSGKYVVWLNEYGIKVMRSKLHLESADSDHAWKRIAHIDRPQTDEWETMAGVWKGRAEWIDEKAIESGEMGQGVHADSSSATATSVRLREQSVLSKRAVERLLVGWGGTIWIIHVHEGGPGSHKNAGEKAIGRAEIAKILRMDCIISGISLYTQNLLLVLAFCSPHDEDENDEADKSAKGGKRSLSKGSEDSEPSRVLRRRPSHQPPELRLIDLNSQAEVDKDGLSVSRFERLTSADYHLGVLPAHTAASTVASKGTLEALAGLGTDMWNAAINPKSLFSSGASIRSRDSGDDAGGGSRAASTAGTVRSIKGAKPTVHPSLVKPGAKIFIHSPYDCILGTKRDLADHLSWLLEHQQYARAWELLDENPDIVSAVPERLADIVSTPSKHHPGTDDFYDDESVSDPAQRSNYSSAEKEKRRIGELWIQELVEEGSWETAGQVCGKVLTTPDRWEKWVWTFAGAKKFGEITNHIPSTPMHPPLPSTIYEVVLGHYLQTDKPRFKELLELWSTDLFDVSIVSTALENQLKFRDVREDSVDNGEKGRNWRIVMESLARLYEAGGRNREALKCCIKLHDADSAFRLIRDGHLAEAVADDIPSFIALRVDPERQMSEQELGEATSEAITLLVDEAQHGLVRPEVVVEQLQGQQLYPYFQSLVDDFADLAVHLFSMYDRPMLMEFLKSSTSYTFEKAVQECESFEYHDELVYLYSKTGQMKRALYLIIDRLKNVEKAIEFAKEQDDPDLWEDLLNYSMDKPTFIRALLEQVGTAINPITLVRRIPEKLKIQGLREGLTHMMKEHELQHSISSGAVRVLRSELATAQNELRAGQRRGIKFEVVPPSTGQARAKSNKATNGVEAAASRDDGADEKTEHERLAPLPGRCASCSMLFTEFEMETLVGFACGHVFHLSHLLEMLHKGKEADVDLGGENGEGGRYSIGMKVMRARLLRDRVRGGCPICAARAT
ncbi:clathrin and VPS domain-containing protein [Hirsutella rhossiliensis]|uniref:Clathrin and VPS domain-containing protein n=1 Tax=Hirsutella rhossiliensis TaxID=111463 RepID=A0A9P8SLR8_9HYPO|nr:clathrin and VPS domain-containing protein [Hirsutella rhossiliensis]KAH0965436.1 clathrin and VPS domain-containing protein [Hirsutella rhossiliensis]